MTCWSEFAVYTDRYRSKANLFQRYGVDAERFRALSNVRPTPQARHVTKLRRDVRRCCAARQRAALRTHHAEGTRPVPAQAWITLIVGVFAVVGVAGTVNQRTRADNRSQSWLH